jgi:hypothetical protein
MYAHGKGTSLLWINKDKSNLESRDHTNLVNSHAQRYQRLTDWKRRNPGVSGFKKYYAWSRRPNWNSSGIESVSGEAVSAKEVSTGPNARQCQPSVSATRRANAAERSANEQGRVKLQQETPSSHLAARNRSLSKKSCLQSHNLDAAAPNFTNAEQNLSQFSSTSCAFLSPAVVGQNFREENNKTSRDTVKNARNHVTQQNSPQADTNASYNYFCQPTRSHEIPVRREQFMGRTFGSSDITDEVGDLDDPAAVASFRPFTDWEIDTYAQTQPSESIFSELGDTSLAFDQKDLGWYYSADNWTELYDVGLLTRRDLRQDHEHDLKMPTYLDHPLSPETNFSVSKLPEGFQEAALSLTLSIELLALLGEIQEMNEQVEPTPREQGSFENKDGHKDYRVVLQIADTIGAYDLSLTERLICLGLVAHLLGTDASMHEDLFERHKSHILDEFVALGPFLAPSEAVLWASFVIAASVDDYSRMQAPRLEWMILDQYLSCDSAVSDWPAARCVLHRFFWNTSLESRLENCWQLAVERQQALIHQLSQNLQSLA